jgi:hypothetical protein
MAAENQGMVDFTKGTASALANLATPKSVDRQKVASLTKTTQLAERDAWNKTHDEEFKSLIGKISGTPNAAITHHKVKRPYTTNTNKYCWYHRYQVDNTHTSGTCDRRSDGNKETSMKDNIMGGSTFGVELLWRRGAVNIDNHTSQNHVNNYLNCTPTYLSKTAILDRLHGSLSCCRCTMS